VIRDTVAAGRPRYSERHDGTDVYFCSPQGKAAFAADPDAYVRH
jgi:YHS domain-containing protein